MFEKNACPFTASVFLEILNDIGEAVLVKGCLSHPSSTITENGTGKAHDRLPLDKPSEQLIEMFLCQASSIRTGKRIRSSTGAESSLLRQAAARKVALCYLIEFYMDISTVPCGPETVANDLGHYLFDSPEVETVSSCAVIEHLGRILTQRKDNTRSAIVQNVAPVLLNLLRTTTDDEVKRVTQAVLADLIDCHGVQNLPSILVNDMSQDSSDATRADHIEPPSVYESSLRLHGPFLDLNLQTQAEWTTRLADETQRFVRQLRCALHETNVSIDTSGFGI